MANTLILASSSSRRHEILEQVKIPFITRKKHVNESQVITSNPIEKTKQLATIKGRAVNFNKENEIILAADTVVCYDHKILEKPINKEEAFNMLTQLSGNIHDVYTSIFIRSVTEETLFVERSKVEFWPLSKKEIEWYISTNEPYDKAGAYGVQSIGAIFVKQIIGDYYNVVGLPISRVVQELKKHSIKPLLHD